MSLPASFHQSSASQSRFASPEGSELRLPAPPRKRKLPQVRLKGFDAFVKSLRNLTRELKRA